MTPDVEILHAYPVKESLRALVALFGVNPEPGPDPRPAMAAVRASSGLVQLSGDGGDT